jgi:molybdopterin converting factor small subunit
MQINIELYASLMQYLPPGNSRFRREIRVDEGFILSRVIEQFHIPPKMAHIVLVNGHFINPEDRSSRALIEGDVVAMWPPVAGG